MEAARAAMQDVADVLLAVAREMETWDDAEAYGLANEIHNYALHSTAALTSLLERLTSIAVRRNTH